MMRRILQLLVLSMLFAVGRSSYAGPPQVTYNNAAMQSQQITYGTRGWIVTIGAVANPGPSGTILVEATDPNTPIERIQITPGLHPSFPTQQNLVLLVRARAGTSGTIPYLGTVVRSGTYADLWIGNITIQGTFGDPGALGQDAITAQSVNIVRAAEIAGTITSLGSNQVPGAVGSIIADSGRILGSITANGEISRIDAAGTVGQVGNFATITARSGLRELNAQAVYANITTNADGTGGLRRLTTSSGPFEGSLRTQFVAGPAPEDGITVSGALNASVEIAGDCQSKIEAAGVGAGKLIEIGGSLTEAGTYDGRIALSASMEGMIRIGGSLDGAISLPSGGLVGQIVVNNNNGTDNWTGNVTVESIVLGPGQPAPDTGPYYARPSLPDLGGGAVGEAPFHLYENDCSPVNDSYMTRQAFEANGAIVRYYGPIEFGDPGLIPIVEMRDPYHETKWGSVDNMFTVIEHPTGVAARERSVKVIYSGTAGDLGLGWYRLRLRSGGLVCSDVTGSPDAVGDYYFTIGLNCNASPDGAIDVGDFIDAENNEAICDDDIDCNCNRILDECEVALDGSHTDKDSNGVPDDCEIGIDCPCDFNNNQVLNSQDFFDYLTCFFGGTCPTGRTADYNNDTAVNSQDFFDFLTCFFAGCG